MQWKTQLSLVPENAFGPLFFPAASHPEKSDEKDGSGRVALPSRSRHLDESTQDIVRRRSTRDVGRCPGLPWPIRSDAALRPPDRLVDQPVEFVTELELAGGVDLGHHDPDHLVPGVDPEVGVIDPAPTEGARRVLLAVGAGLRGHAEAVAEGEPVNGNPERQALSLVTGHQVDRLGPEDAGPFQLAAVER